jgi:hypothetical protein
MVGICLAVICAGIANASIDPKSVIQNIEKNDKQYVLTGKIDSLAIIRGNATFKLGPGNLTIFDFGSGRPCGLTFMGEGHFTCIPPNDVERNQLRKFTNKDTINGAFNEATFFFTVELDNFPDTAGYVREIAGGDAWSRLQGTRDDAWDHLKLNMTNKLIGDLLTPGPGTFFYADFEFGKYNRLLFMEDPFGDDLYQLAQRVMIGGSRTVDILSGYSPENDLVSQRGVLPIDISHYSIDSKIETSGKMTINCRISYLPTRWGRQFIYFGWYPDNKMISVLSSSGDTLEYITRKDEHGFGVILNKPLEGGATDSLIISYECKAMENIWGVYYMYLGAPSCWYPWNHISDKATFDLSFDHSKDYQIISVGDSVETSINNDRVISRWKVDKPVVLASFGYGAFELKDVPQTKIPSVKVFMSQSIPHAEMAQYLGSLGDLSGKNMLERVSSDVTASLTYFTDLLGPCPFNMIKVTETPFSFGQSPPGMIFLSWWTFQGASTSVSDYQFRAHEVSHQWWGHTIDNESYRDTWIIEGLADYSGYCAFQAATANADACKLTLENWRDAIIKGAGVHSDGSKAGSVTMGYRLASTKSNDYTDLVYYKGAYIFHMIRYLMHDFKSGSDEAFAAFLKNLINEYRGKTITTERLRTVLEENVGGDMSWFFKQWVYGTDIPEYKYSYKTTKTNDTTYNVTMHIKQERVPSDFQMVIPLTVFFEEDKHVHLKVFVDQPEMDVDLPLLPLEPKKIEFNTCNAVLCRVEKD